MGSVRYFHNNISCSIYACLATKAVWIFSDSHILFPVIAFGAMFHAVLHFAHARCAKAVSPAGMFHGDGIIDGNVQQRFPLFSLNNFLLSIVVEHDV